VTTQLAKVVNRQQLQDMAGASPFARGEAYFKSGQVHDLVEHQGTLTAKVSGRHDYRVKLWVDGDALNYDCTCPVVVNEGAFCKHGVAVGLAWLAGTAAEGKVGKAGQPAVTLQDVELYLQRQSKETLLSLLLEQVLENDRLRERLLLKVARATATGLDLDTFRRAIDRAVHHGGFVEYGEAWGYAQGIREVISSLQGLLEEGYASEVIELSEYALGHVDDSDGEVGNVLEELQALHHSAYLQAKPDPQALARQLFAWELHSDRDTFFGAAPKYADVLGPLGLAKYRELAEAEWQRMPELRPGQSDSERFGKRFRITHIMETLARQSGDLEALVAIKRRDLSSAYAYLQIAELYRQAGQYDQALAWAEQGLAAFPDRADERLRDFLAEEYHRRQRHEDALALIWAEFSERPFLSYYQKLKAHADRLQQWPKWREQALVWLRGSLAQAKKNASPNHWSSRWGSDHSELVCILLWEHAVEAAWQEAQAGGCTDDLWLQLASQRESDHPEQVLPIYQRQIERLIEQKNNTAYEQAVQFVRKVRALLQRLGRDGEFASYLEALRKAHKPKRNLMALLNQLG
jgi:uncharacterized Zn finger protein